MATAKSEGRAQPARRRAARDGLVASTAAAAALRQLNDLISSEPVGVTSVEPLEDGWLVEVEVVEERRVPSSADVLALYEVELDGEGEMLAFHRSKRYGRGKGGSGNEGS
ncbi:gas vesicle protein GvpO [Amycolatopsis rhabdoformis]|uniref:Gas vesicle protein GvpO n=1 Tax=Amycolatopsis rhabdoformis TaxID=1448059 RepID=A0ABZ1IKG5_9PSEU|nr:gas vesicle protein GvpO [Amycolatopsis rhabdoformis]WSE34670.1 gas vesicle protein GvpO [Amycolatopsis rhabdoformis]